MQINISEIISTDYKVQTFNPEIEMEVFVWMVSVIILSGRVRWS